MDWLSYSTRIVRIVSAVVAMVLAMASPLHAKTDAPRTEAEDVQLQKYSFRLPDEGQRNNNGSIGPFCCTGRTAIIRRADGIPVGYAYFYSWKGQAYNTGAHSSAAPDIQILVSALSDLADSNSKSRQDSISFLAKEMSPGASRSIQVGRLAFKVTILQAIQLNCGAYVDMSSVRAQLDVSTSNTTAATEVMRSAAFSPVSSVVASGSSDAGRIDTDSVQLQRYSFRFPEEAQPNNNGSIGPFCCTGRTVTVRREDGGPVGYAYFFGWKGQAYRTSPDSSKAPDIQILVSGLANLADLNSESRGNAICFSAQEMSPGASRSARAGALEFKITILEATQLNGGKYFDMGSVAAQLDVSVPPQ